PARLDNAPDLGRARAAPAQAGYDDRRTSEQSAARSSGPMIYLDSSVALAYLLAEDRFPPDIGTSRWFPAGFSNARFGIGSTRISSKIPMATRCGILIGRVAM